MKGERRAPGVEHGGDAILGPRCLGLLAIVSVASAAALNEQIIDHGLVLVGDIGTRTRQREHEVEIPMGSSSASRSASHCLAAAP